MASQPPDAFAAQHALPLRTRAWFPDTEDHRDHVLIKIVRHIVP